MLLELPQDIQHTIVWRYCALPDRIRLDYDTVRALRLTCRALYTLLDSPRRWNILARHHYAGVR